MATTTNPHHHGPKLVILGRDGILNVFREDHVKAPQEWIPIDGALESVARLNQAGWHAVVATNQSGIGRGLVDMTSLNAIHQHMIQQLAARGGRIDAVFICPHVPEDQCSCRKPLPGLMRMIAERYGVDDLSRVPMACDTARDLQAAHAAGCEPHVVRSGRAAALPDAELEKWTAGIDHVHVHPNLAALAEFLLHREHTERGVVGEDSRPLGLGA
ncbi:MAG: D-glycero-beta-D-manno-heptose 1,7-bisphosphate 7-phosphatase [Aquincola sp.]|nr:D-glycero-beta-D-manno-heptose 1,7-bisphosphate 7-phosphatase [Aquincola sp.]MDH4288677.1 D-glycero-beta-D-manno-heptose 1,7-bisphosphate 7-phosphatase [Aquincola sp.]MDH5329639.1 D-glycero-beta-D-manno-heptose 1,7-bisphosphate 7-phosphatase [Aquincola sp.]